MIALTYLGSALAAGLLVYLFAALLIPEKMS